MDICSSEEAAKFFGWKWTILFLCLFLTFVWICCAPSIFSIQSFGSLYWLSERQQCWFTECGKRIIIVINELHPYLERNTAGASLNTAVAWARMKSPSYSRRATEIIIKYGLICWEYPSIFKKGINVKHCRWLEYGSKVPLKIKPLVTHKSVTFTEFMNS